MIRLLGFLLTATCLFYSTAAQAQALPEISYHYDTLEETNSVGGLNKHEEYITGLEITPSRGVGVLVDRHDRRTMIECSQWRSQVTARFTGNRALNNQGTVVGACDIFGFIKRKHDSIPEQFSFPGAESTDAFGVADNEYVVGQYLMPATFGKTSFLWRMHSFFRNNNGDWHTLPVPPVAPQDAHVPNPITVTQVLAINNKEQVLGFYTTFNSEGGGPDGPARSYTFEHGVFDTLNVPGFPSAWAITFNNRGDIVFSSGRGDFILYKDREYVFIAHPPGYRWAVINGINDDGQLTGTLVSQSTRQSYIVIATPNK